MNNATMKIIGHFQTLKLRINSSPDNNIFEMSWISKIIERRHTILKLVRILFHSTKIIFLTNISLSDRNNDYSSQMLLKI